MRFEVDISPPDTEGMSRAHTISNYLAYIGFMVGVVPTLLLSHPGRTIGIALSLGLFFVSLSLWVYAETRDAEASRPSEPAAPRE